MSEASPHPRAPGLARPVENLCEPVLMDLGILHGFGQRGSQAPADTRFSRQVHGARVVEVADLDRDPAEVEADVLLGSTAGIAVGIVTADCVPILAAARDGRAVAAIHAGWRGLAAGVIEAGIAALRQRAGGEPLVCAVGPAARGCCYEVDEPVRRALVSRYPERLEGGVLAPGRDADHFQLDLPRLATGILEALGLESERIGTLHRVCTVCDPARFESHRRDGVRAGRLRHFVVRPGVPGGQG